MSELKDIKPLQMISEEGAICDPVTGVCAVPGQAKNNEIENEVSIEETKTRQTEKEVNK